MKKLKQTVCILLALSAFHAQAQNTFPNGIFVSKGSSSGGSGLFSGTTYTSHFHYSTTEDTYIRGGKATSNVLIGDVGAAVILGNASGNVYTSGILHAQKGLNVTSGIYATKNANNSGAGVFVGTQYATHFQYGANEDTYIRGGKTSSLVIIGDVGAQINLGHPASTVYASSPVVAYNSITASRGNNPSGAAMFSGSQYTSHFCYSTNEDTYIRGGKSTSNLYIADVNNNVVMGSVPSLPAGYRLFVDKGILTEKVKVAVKTSGDWADHVFHKNYPLMPLNEVEAFVQTNGHLPGIPSAKEVVNDGIDLGKMNAKLLEKIEELTLYSIELKKEISLLREQMLDMQKKQNSQ